MGHVVHYRDAAGELRLDDVTSLDAALERAEQLRNDDDVEEVRIFKEIRTQVRTYYKVVAVDDEAPSDAPDVPAADAPAEATGQPDEAPPPAPAEGGDATDAPQPPSGSMPLSGPPHVKVHPEATEGDAPDGPPGESRRPSFLSRGG